MPQTIDPSVYKELWNYTNTLSRQNYPLDDKSFNKFFDLYKPIKDFYNQDEQKSQKNSLFIYNSVGQFVKSVHINNQSSITINCQGLAAGVYYIKNKGTNDVLKFIKK